MKKIEKRVADNYFRARTTMIILYLAIGFLVSFVVVFFADTLSNFTINNIPVHYYMGAQGAVLTFIILLFINAIVSDKIDKKYGIDPDKNEEIIQRRKSIIKNGKQIQTLRRNMNGQPVSRVICFNHSDIWTLHRNCRI
ncbi:putative solute:sodium symporter small subunit [Thalassobacillus pellis]|nr:putative solute:sodium symporter small subunit [Thalassobacillus pellis]